MGRLYAEIMQTTSDLVDITIRDLGEGSVWNAAVNDPVPAAVLSVETRRGRPTKQRARLASAPIDACSEALDLNPEVLAVEFTQHAGDENYRKFFVDGVLHGALGRDWTPDEPQKPLFEAMKTEVRRKAS